MKIVFCLVFILLLAGTAAIPFLYESPSMYYKFGMAKTLLRSGKMVGCLAAVLIFLSPVFVVRLKLMDTLFGQDRLWQFHKYNGLVLICLVLAHPILILWSERFSFFPFEKRYWPEFLGIALLLVLFLTLIFSWFKRQIGLGWNQWFIAHRIIAPLIFLGVSIHVLNVSKPFGTGLPKMALISAAVLAFLFTGIKWARSLGFFKQLYWVSDINRGGQDAWVLTAKPDNRVSFDYMPGQFAYLSVRANGLPKEAHPFTIASSPTLDNKLQFVIRDCGDFTHKIKNIVKGDQLFIEGPYGRFSHLLLKKRSDLILIAGGIGITPMLSMLRYMADKGDNRKVILIWSNQTRDHLIFESELKSMQEKMKGLKIHTIFTRQKEAHSKFNRIDKQSLESMLTDVKADADLFLCGPPAMIMDVKTMLKTIKFPLSRVYTESFLL